MGLNHNGGRMEFNIDDELQYPTIPQNNVIYILFKGPLIPPDSIWFLNTFLEKKKFNKYDNSRFEVENIRVNLNETYKKTQFIWMDTDIIIEIIDKLYDYYIEYKNSLLDDLDKIDKTSTELFENDIDKAYRECIESEYRQAFIMASRKAEEYLIEMLKMKYTLDSWIKNDEFYLDKLRFRLEWLILDCFWDFEREKKYLNDLEEWYKTAINEFMLDYFWDFECKFQNLEKEYETKINELLQNCETNSNLSKEEIELKMLNNFWIKQRRDVARQCIWRLKNEIYRLVRWFDVILSKDLLSKLWKYQEFSELLLENDNKILNIEVVY